MQIDYESVKRPVSVTILYRDLVQYILGGGDTSEITITDEETGWTAIICLDTDTVRNFPDSHYMQVFPAIGMYDETFEHAERPK